MGLALSNDGKPVPSKAANACRLIPKGAKNVAVAKDFLKYLIQPQVVNEYLKTGLGRNIPAMPSIVKDDPWWLDRRTRTARPTSSRGCSARPCRISGPSTRPMPRSRTSMSGASAWTDIMQGGMTPQAAAEKAFKRVEEIFAKYPIAQS